MGKGFLGFYRDAVGLSDMRFLRYCLSSDYEVVVVFISIICVKFRWVTVVMTLCRVMAFQTSDLSSSSQHFASAAFHRIHSVMTFPVLVCVCVRERHHCVCVCAHHQLYCSILILIYITFRVFLVIYSRPTAAIFFLLQTVSSLDNQRSVLSCVRAVLLQKAQSVAKSGVKHRISIWP